MKEITIKPWNHSKTYLFLLFMIQNSTYDDLFILWFSHDYNHYYYYYYNYKVCTSMLIRAIKTKSMQVANFLFNGKSNCIIFHFHDLPQL